MKYVGEHRSEKWNPDGATDVAEDGLEPLSTYEAVKDGCRWPAPGDIVRCCGRDANGIYCEEHKSRAWRPAQLSY